MAGLMRLGLFGGTFDPLHMAHLILAAEAHFQLTLDRVLWVLTPDPPHKDRRITAVEQRMEMLDAAIVDNPNFESSRVDVDRGGPYYAVDTVKLLRTEYPRAQLVYLMGGDSLHDLTSWHLPRDFVAACDELGVMRRPDDRVDLDSLEGEIPGLSAKVRFVNAPLLDISGTQLRHRIAAGQPFRYYVPVSVYQIIQERDLYRWVVN
ncbi:MAG TPA: nicotinate-nucleotide adenylyltransferase [Anaerolineales bacterium]